MTAERILDVTELGVERRCNRCGEWWPLDEEFFYRNPKGVMGYTGRCKACIGEARPRHDYHPNRLPADRIAAIREDRLTMGIHATARRHGVSARTVIRHTLDAPRVDGRFGVIVGPRAAA